jgi:hypothetical protein
MVLCMTDTFTKYVESVALTDKEAETISVDLQIWNTTGDRVRQWQRIQEQVGRRIVQEIGH